MNTPLGPTAQYPEDPILFFDGDCGFCNGSVRFVLRHEQEPLLMFAPLRGPTASDVLGKSQLPPDIGTGTIVLFDKGQYLIRSRAALRIMEYMGGVWSKLSGVLRLFPVPFADLVYRVVARLRNHLPSGQSCSLLPPDKRRRFLP